MFASASGAKDASEVPKAYVVPSTRRCAGTVLFHNALVAQQSMLGTLKSALMTRFTKYYAVLRHSTIQFYESKYVCDKNGRPSDIFVLLDGYVCKKTSKRQLDGTLEHTLFIVTQKSSGTVVSKAELRAPDGQGSEHIDQWFSAILKVLASLRMMRIQVGSPVPIAKLSCQGYAYDKLPSL